MPRKPDACAHSSSGLFWPIFHHPPQLKPPIFPEYSDPFTSLPFPPAPAFPSPVHEAPLIDPSHPTSAETTASAPTTPPLYQRLDTTAHFPYPLSEYLRKFLWEWVECTMIRWSFRRAEGWRRFWLRLFGAKISDTCKIKPTTIIKHPWLLSMGEYSVLSEGVEVYNLGPVSIGDHTVVSQNVYLCAGSHDITKTNLPLTRPSITIGKGIWICAGAFINPGITIGDNSIVAAGAVVVKDVPPAVIVGGNPAQVIRPRPIPN